MSLNLLRNLNGNRSGKLYSFIQEFEGKREPRIAWYPSAGEDFRALLYLHPCYSQINAPIQQEPAPPDLFLLQIITDLYPGFNEAVEDVELRQIRTLPGKSW